MQSFIFGAMNKACREKDSSKILFYGPLASALGYIIHSAETKRIRRLSKKDKMS